MDKGGFRAPVKFWMYSGLLGIQFSRDVYYPAADFSLEGS
jgi:hypothetical protein